MKEKKRTFFRPLRRLMRAVANRPSASIAIGFFQIILLGAVLLSLPMATNSGESIGFFDGLFTATSAVCVTGLIVRDTATTFSTFGRVVLLLLIQLGGLGFMTFAIVVFGMFGKHLSVRTRLLASESINQESSRGLLNLMRWILLSTLAVEGTGAVLLSIRLIPLYGVGQGIFYSVFHAVSAFCNAGFDLFGNYSSLTGFVLDPLMNFTVIFLVIVGGFGFAVLNDLRLAVFEGRKHRLMLQTKIVAVTYSLLFFIGAAFTLLSEWSNPATMGGMNVGQKIMAALFQSMTWRTAGFNTIDQLALNPATKLVGCFMMFIGAAPASTGGGVKVTTFACLVLLVRATARGHNQIAAHGRRIRRELVQRAVVIMTIALFNVFMDVLLMSLTQPQLNLLDLAYECFSAMGTVGISALGTPGLNLLSKTLIIITMFAGRIGPMTLALLLARRNDTSELRYEYAEGRFMIG